MQKTTKYFLISILLFIGFKSFCQKHKKPQNLARYDFQKIHFGFTLGINNLNFNLQQNTKITTNDSLKTIHTKGQKGFNLGIVSNLRLGKYTDLRFVPALIFRPGSRLLGDFPTGMFTRGRPRLNIRLPNFPAEYSVGGAPG